MSRAITRRYLDPLDAVWLGAAERMGFVVVRSPDVYASTDGHGTLLIGTDETLDAVVGLADDLGVGVHIHVAEDASDIGAGARLAPHADDE